MKGILTVALVLVGISAGHCEYSETENKQVAISSNGSENIIKEVIRQEIPYVSDDQLQKVEERLLPSEVDISSGKIGPQNYNSEAIVVQYPDGPDGMEKECNQEFLKQARKVVEIVKSGTRVPYITIKLPKNAGSLQVSTVFTLFRTLLKESKIEIPLILKWSDTYSSHEEYISEANNRFQRTSTSVVIKPDRYQKVLYSEQHFSSPAEVRDYPPPEPAFRASPPETFPSEAPPNVQRPGEQPQTTN